ncbi:FadR/GntR family transcriptional regulator [Neobacillus niacini]|uniref:FadR/GntR family transcriptional regulator n=1 Tax=Neobacillus niacini TaxID=86668 RepID=UPI002FFF02E9
MEYKQIKPKKINEEVAEALHEMIRTGQLKPGDKLESVQQLSENFQVSRSATREALSALKAMGLVEMKQGEGTFVKKFEAKQLNFPLSTAILMNKKDVAHLLEVRKIIETGAAALAAKNRSEADLTAMADALNEMKMVQGDEELGEKADFKFHLAIAAASQNPILSTLLDQVSELMIETMKETRRLWLYSKQKTMEKAYKEHVQLYQAILEKNEEKSRIVINEHLENVENILKKYFLEADEE